MEIKKQAAGFLRGALREEFGKGSVGCAGRAAHIMFVVRVSGHVL